MAKHARLAPSSSHRWINCPGSIRLSAGIGSNETEYAAEGTVAHEIAARCLEENREAADFLDQVVTAGKYEITVDEEMVEGVQLYVDHVLLILAKCKGPYWADFEQRLDMRHLHPDVWGTGDTVIYDREGEWLHVVDFKYGKGVVVEVSENPQLFTYGSGAAHRYHNRPIKGITLWVVQPRAPHADGPIRSYEADLIELLEFENAVAKAAEATDAEDAPLYPGEWCRFCPALAICPAAREKSEKAALAEFAEADKEPSDMTPKEIAKVLKEADFILSWVKAVQEYAHAEATAGRIAPGFKLVPKRATRKWKDEDVTIKEFNPILGDDIFTEPKLRSPAQIEKLMGKKSFRQYEEELVSKVSSGTNLVPLSDPRQAVKTTGAEDFADA